MRDHGGKMAQNMMLMVVEGNLHQQPILSQNLKLYYCFLLNLICELVDGDYDYDDDGGVDGDADDGDGEDDGDEVMLRLLELNLLWWLLNVSEGKQGYLLTY